jgi:hypothetical protein
MAVFSLSTTYGQTDAIRTGVVSTSSDLKLLASFLPSVLPIEGPELDLGVVPDGQPLKRMLLLLRRGSAQNVALLQLLRDQQENSSPNYHAWLTPEQFGRQFGVSDTDIQIVTTWLTSQGFREINVAVGRTVIEFSGTAGQVRSAFHTEIHRLCLAKTGALREINNIAAAISARLCYKS